MRVLVVSILVVVGLSGASADAATFGAPVTVGGTPTLATVAVAGGGGTFAFVARQQAGIVGAVRRGPGAAWRTRTLSVGVAYSLRDPQIVIDAGGTVTAMWTTDQPSPALVAARAPAGAGFGAAHVVARVNDASGASPRMVALPSGRVLVIFEDRPLRGPHVLSPHAVLETIVLDDGHASAVHDLGVEGAFPGIARAGGGAVVSYVAGAPVCRESVCGARPVRATLLNAAGSRTGPTVTVASDAAAALDPPRITSFGSRAVVSWVRPAPGSASAVRAFTREFSTRPLQGLSGARPFPIYGGPGVGTPSIAILRSGDLLGANVGAAAGQPFGGEAQLSGAPGGGPWQAPAVLSGPSGWTTVPRVSALGDGGALAVFATARMVPGPAAYDITAAERSPTGALTVTTLGSQLSTDDAGGLSSSVAPDDQAIVTWPDASGGVDVVLST
jgi:hypothetical protein